MDALFGVATKEYVILASDTFFRSSVVVAKTNHIRCVKLGQTSAVITAGHQGDCDRTIRQILETLKYEEVANCLPITEKTFTSCLQKYMHSMVRKRQLDVTSLVGGVSEGEGKLFYVDQYGAATSANYFGAGYSSYLFLSAMDMRYRSDLPKEEAIKIIKEIYEGVKRKLVVSYGSLHICTITIEGIQEEKEN